MATLLPKDRLQGRDKGEDRISELPVDIIFTFLSPMEMKEAVKTSILSQRWRYLWAERTHLDFSHFVVIPESDPDPVNVWEVVHKKSIYINWINQVLDLHCGPCIDTFRVWFPFDESDSHHIEKWAKFALLKKVKNLELSLVSSAGLFTFGFDTLTPSLVEDTLVRFKVICISGKLKQLTIHNCYYLEELEVDVINLLKFDYFTLSKSTKVVFNKVPMLVEAAFGGQCWDASASFSEDVSPISAQILKLSLNLMDLAYPTEDIPNFCKLKQLHLRIDCKDYRDEFDDRIIVHFLEACPMLEEFRLEVIWHRDEDILSEAGKLQEVKLSSGNVLADDVENVVDLEDYFESEIQFQLKTHTKLQVLHVTGFSGCDADVDFIFHFVDFACNLETIICDPNPGPYDSCSPEMIEVARCRAGKLVEIIPPKISLEIK